MESKVNWMRLKALVARRILLAQGFPPCPSCGEKEQVQLANHLVVPAKWKCRICKFKFELETY